MNTENINPNLANGEIKVIDENPLEWKVNDKTVKVFVGEDEMYDYLVTQMRRQKRKILVSNSRVIILPNHKIGVLLFYDLFAPTVPATIVPTSPLSREEIEEIIEKLEEKEKQMHKVGDLKNE